MSRLIPLADIPYGARSAERKARERHSFWFPALCETFTFVGNYSAACKAATAEHPGANWEHTSVRRATKQEALAATAVRIVSAPGCHGRPYFDPPEIGWVCSREAGDALAARPTHMPDGTSHCRLAVEVTTTRADTLTAAELYAGVLTVLSSDESVANAVRGESSAA